MRKFAWPLRALTTLVAVVAAIFVGIGLWDYYIDAPWTRDGRIRTDVAIIAPDVSGLVSEVLVRDNQHVKKGDILFRIDPERFRLALREAEAQVAARDAANIQAALDYARYSKLTDLSVTQQQLELSRANAESAKAELRSGRRRARSRKAQSRPLGRTRLRQWDDHQYGIAPRHLYLYRPRCDGADRRRHAARRRLFRGKRNCPESMSAAAPRSG